MKRNRISCAKIMRRRALFLDDGPCVKLRRGESFDGGGLVFWSRFPRLFSLRLSSSSKASVAQMCICDMRERRAQSRRFTESVSYFCPGSRHQDVRRACALSAHRCAKTFSPPHNKYSEPFACDYYESCPRGA